MSASTALNVNGRTYHLEIEPDTPLLYVLRNDLGLKGPKFGCGLEQCGACKVLVEGQAVPSCRLPIRNVQGLPITTIEGLGTAGDLHPLQAAFIEEQAIQCGYCAAGMIIAAQGLLNRTRYPTDDDIRQALADNLCRCGVYERVRRAIRLRIGRPVNAAIYELRSAPPVAAAKATADLPRALQQTPDLDDWVRINSNGTVTFFTGKVEYGQGLQTALAQIGAEELDVSLARIRLVMADTAQTPDEGVTAGSMSLETSGSVLRWAAAEARHRLLALAYEELEAPLERLVVADGVVTDPASGRSLSYWQIHGGRPFGGQVTGSVPPKRPQRYTVAGQPATRLDLPSKVAGVPSFVHDLDLPGMVHGRVVRPPHASARLISADVAAATRMPGVLKVVQDGSFLAVIAEREEQAIQAMAALRDNAAWSTEPLPTHPTNEPSHVFVNQPDKPFLVVNGAAVEASIPSPTVPPNAAHTLTAAYSRPYQMHASLGPSAAVALLSNGKLTLWTHSQGIFGLRAAIAPVLSMAEADIHVIYHEGSGCYGHNGADDAALDAALLARALPERPVSLKWMRADEHGWEPYAPATLVRMQASLDDAGVVIDWNHDVYSPSHFGRPQPGAGVSGLLAAGHLEDFWPPPPPQPSRGAHSGSHRNADPLYAFPRRRIVKHHLPHTPLRVSTMRSLGAFANVFAIESFMDEMAWAAGTDPVAFRLGHLTDERARAVIEAAAEKAGWQARPRHQGNGRGRGIAFAQYKNRQTYAAVVVDLSVDVDSGRIHLERVVIAADAGRIVNPDGLSNQLEGGFVQSASQSLFEQVLWDEQGVISLDWDSYPILRFPDAPLIETVLLNRPDRPPVGAGEAAQGPTPAAIANAIFDAAGIRLRDIPFTPERVQRALDRT